MIRLKQLTPELKELYGVTEEQKIFDDPDFVALNENDRGLYSVLTSLSTAYNNPDSHYPASVEHIKNLLRKYRPEAKKILDDRAKVLAQAAGLKDYRLGYLTSQYFLLLAIFKDNTGTTCGYRLYDELRDCYNDYTAESVTARLKEHSVRIHNMFLIDDKIYISGGEDAYTHLGTDGSVLEVPFLRLGKKGGEVVAKSSSKQKRTPLVFFRIFDYGVMTFMDYEGNLVYYNGAVISGNADNYTKMASNSRASGDFSWITYSFSKGTNLSAKTNWNSEQVAMLHTEVNSDYSREIVPYYFGLASSSCLFWDYPSFGFVESRFNEDRTTMVPVSEPDIVPTDIAIIRRGSRAFSYEGLEFKPQYQDTLFGNAASLRGSMILAPRGTSEAYVIRRSAEDETNLCFYPGYSYSGSDSFYYRSPLCFSVVSVMTMFFNSVSDGILLEKTRRDCESLFEKLDEDFSDEYFGQFRAITACMGYPNAIKYFPYSIPTVFLKRWQEMQAQMSTLAVSGKYLPTFNNSRFLLKLATNTAPASFISVPENTYHCILDKFDSVPSLDTVQVPGDCYKFSCDTSISNLIFLPTSKILNLSIELCTREVSKVQIAGTSVEEILYLSYTTLRCRSKTKMNILEITAPVKKIAPWAMCFDTPGGAQKIIFPSTLEVLGAHALSDASIEYACFKGCEIIGEHAFENNTSLRRVDFPSNLKIIAEKAFGYCSKLKSVELSSCEKIEAETFLGCEKLTSVTLPDNLVEIGNSAFAGCVNLLEIVIPASCKKIGRDAFKDCASLTSLVFSGSPSGIEIDKDAFSSCSYDILKQVEPYIHRSRRKSS